MAAKRGARTTRVASARADREAPQAREVNVAEVTLDITTLDKLTESVNIALYGPSGHGKTSFGAFAPNLSILACEPGVKAARLAGAKPKNVIRAPGWAEIEAGTKWADDNLGEDDWLMVDSGTKAQNLYIRWLLRRINEENPSRDLDIPALADHQKWQNRYKRWVDHLIDARYNTIVIFGVMYKEDEEGESLVLPNILGGQHMEVCNYVISQFDMGLYLAVSDRTDPPGQRRVLAQPTGAWWAKDRFQVMGRYWDIPDGDYTAMADLAKYIKDPSLIEKDEVPATPIRATTKAR